MCFVGFCSIRNFCSNTLGCIVIFTNDETLVTTVKDTYIPVENPFKYVSRLGYTRFVICSSYWEQQTNAILNLWPIQKWANVTGFRVVEPFASQSTLGLLYQVLYNYNNTSPLHFSDYFDWISGTPCARKIMESHHLRSGVHLLMVHVKKQL